MNTLSTSLSSVLLLAVALPAQCAPVQQVSPPFTIPLAAGQWQIQHFGQPLQAGRFEYVIVSLPAAVPIPLTALPTLFCNTVGNMGSNPCLYVDLGGIAWFDFGPSPGVSTTVGFTWPNNPALSGTLFVAQFGHAGCAGPGPDQSVVITGVIQ